MESRFFDEIEVNVDEEGNTSSDELESLCSDEEGDDAIKFIRFNPKLICMIQNFMGWDVFTDAKEFKEAVRAHAVVWQRNVVFVKNDQSRVRAKCKGHNCHWVVLASKMKDSNTFQIRTLNTSHKCERTLSKNKFVTSRLLINKHKTDWRLNNGWKFGDFKEKVHLDLNCEISTSQYYRTKKKVNDMLNGQYKDQYARLWDYSEEIKRSNPNSTMVFKTYVDSETGEDKFQRQKGLLPALYELLPDIEHRYCVMHMYNNFKKEHPGLALKDRLWKVARATTVNQFKFQMASLKEFDEGAHNWLADVLPRHWSRSHFRTFPKGDILLNNICESFNAAILEARNKPLLSMMECIRVYLMKRMEAKRECLSRWNIQMCPKILKKLEKLKDNTRSCISTYAGMAKFEVRDMYSGQYAVDLEQHTCTCRRWELCGIPCVHAISAIMSAEREVEQYINVCKGPIAPPGDINYVVGPKSLDKQKMEGHNLDKQIMEGHNLEDQYQRESAVFASNLDITEANVLIQLGECGRIMTDMPSILDKIIGTAVAPSVAPPAAPPTANISGVSLKASFVKKGRNCVTLKSLETAASSRSMKVPFDGCSAKKTKS
ncbi:hypothetical protein BUALT_Bualt18G0017200 [Buddleja alternifolia]|uniref:SWIM-type domain-containing protein n=1 Tax=Buddleja alternifolia TaxID=168488 RepID=A0AAV6WC32_9LAMI|nr:hypothetical protein BUALT_Bualt18G0017200 [Buddleja alternifolia]